MLHSEIIENPKKEPIRARLTVVETIYHQQGDEGAVSVESKYEHLTEEEEPFKRIYRKVGPEGAQLDTGWVENIGLVHLENQSSHEVFLTEDIDNPPISTIPPGCSIRLYSPRQMRIFCCEQARVVSTVFPK